MSVINKMLKDLEDRDQEQSADFDPSGALYQAKEKSKLPLLLGAMLVLIVALGGAVAWLLMNQSVTVPSNIKQAVQPNTDAASTQPVAIVQSDEVSQPEKKQEGVATPTVSIQAPAPVPPKPVETKPTETKPVDKPQIEQPRVAPEESLHQTDIINDEFIEESFDDLSNEQPLEASPPPPRPALRIEKSASNLTREERIEKLMVKAQESFDKGYISDAITQLEEVMASADSHVKARNLLAIAWYGRGELQQAINILNDGLNRYPNTEEWRVTAAKIFFKDNELQGAFTYLDAELVDASAEYYSMQGTLARQLKRFDKAEVAYANLTKLEPEKGNWWLGYAIAADSQNKAALAVQGYQQAISKVGLSPASIKFARQRIERLKD